MNYSVEFLTHGTYWLEIQICTDWHVELQPIALLKEFALFEAPHCFHLKYLAEAQVVHLSL